MRGLTLTQLPFDFDDETFVVPVRPPTRVVESDQGWWIKREDLAYYTSPLMPSGAKMRQLDLMIDAAPDDAVLAMGCHAVSAMQVYIAAMGQLRNRKAYVAIPSRARESASAQWAERHGAVVERVHPGYPNMYHAHIKKMTQGMQVIRWDNRVAAADTAQQVENIPADAKRIVVPSVSGLAAAGVIGGLVDHDRGDVEVVVAAVADKNMRKAIESLVLELFGYPPSLYRTSYEAKQMPYDRPFPMTLDVDGGVELDPYYESKVVRFLQPGDVLWAVGRRPAAAVGYAQ